MTDTSNSSQPEKGPALQNGRDDAAKPTSASSSNGVDHTPHRSNDARRREPARANGALGNGSLGNGAQSHGSNRHAANGNSANGRAANGNGSSGHAANGNAVHGNGRARPSDDAASDQLFGPAATPEYARVTHGTDSGESGFGAAVEQLGETLEEVLPKLDVHREELLAASVANRFAVLIDGPRTELLLDAAERSSRAPEEILIEILDRFFDSDH